MGPSLAAGNAVIVKPDPETLLSALKLAQVLESVGLPDSVFEEITRDNSLAANAFVSGVYWAAGQNGLHVACLLLHENIYDEFVRRFVTIGRGDKLDETTDMSPFISERAAFRVERLVNDALKAGVTVRIGGVRHGSSLAPTLLEDVPDRSCVKMTACNPGPTPLAC